MFALSTSNATYLSTVIGVLLPVISFGLLSTTPTLSLKGRPFHIALICSIRRGAVCRGFEFTLGTRSPTKESGHRRKQPVSGDDAQEEEFVLFFDAGHHEQIGFDLFQT